MLFCFGITIFIHVTVVIVSIRNANAAEKIVPFVVLSCQELHNFWSVSHPASSTTTCLDTVCFLPASSGADNGSDRSTSIVRSTAFTRAFVALRISGSVVEDEPLWQGCRDCLLPEIWDLLLFAAEFVVLTNREEPCAMARVFPLNGSAMDGIIGGGLHHLVVLIPSIRSWITSSVQLRVRGA